MRLNRSQFYPNSAAVLPPPLKRQALRQRLSSAQRMLREYKFPIYLFAAHVPLGILLKNSSALALLHPFAVLALGLYFAIRRDVRLEKIACLLAYLMGIEVLWRMSKAPVFWEFGKYAAIIIIVAALVKRNCWKFPALPALYLLFLMPAALITIASNSLGDARDKLSFNLSGPLLLALSCWFFSHLKVNFAGLKKILIFLIVPILSVAVTTLFYTVTNPDIQFNNESNSATSGGYGPNQVSSVLGLGVFICLAIYILFKNNFRETVYLAGLALLFAAQSVLTFSRGGMYNAIGSISLVVLFQLRNLNQSVKRLLPIIGLGVLFLILVFPFLNDFTGGALQDRFLDTDTTGRTDIIDADYHIFLNNPVLGAGVGEAKDLRAEYYGKAVGAHTEFARVLAEHGSFGVLSMLMMAFIAVYCVKRHQMTIGKAITAGAVFWSFLFMLNAGMRIAVPSFLWGLGFVSIVGPPVRRKLRARIQRPNPGL